ncbi:hypothetical protein AHAS_Ahas11G0211800 [Arachis hypogaea]
MNVPQHPSISDFLSVVCILASHFSALLNILYPVFLFFRMSDKGKGKAKATSSKRKRSQSSTELVTSRLSEKRLSEKEKADEATPPTDSEKFSNLYCELQFPRYQERKLILEKKLVIPSNLRREFYCNFFRVTLDSVHLINRPVMVTEVDIEEILHCQPKISDKDAFQRAEEELHSLTFDYDALHSVIAQPGAPWEMDSSKVTPKGMKFEYITKKSKVWQQILSHHVMPSTHFTEIPVDMLVLIWCVLEGKELYLPRLIKRYMWRAHIRGNLLFPCLVTQLTHRAGIPWLPDDESPPAVHGKEKVILWETWVGDRPAAQCRDRAAIAAAFELASSFVVAGPSAAPLASTRPTPSSSSQPTYRLVQCFFERMDQIERRNKRHYEHLRQMIAVLGVDIPSEPDTPSD